MQGLVDCEHDIAYGGLGSEGHIPLCYRLVWVSPQS